MCIIKKMNKGLMEFMSTAWHVNNQGTMLEGCWAQSKELTEDVEIPLV